MHDPHDPAIIVVFLERDLKYTIELYIEGHRVIVDTYNRANLPLGASFLIPESHIRPPRREPVRLLLAA